MKYIIAPLALGTLIATDAAALSCLRPDVVNAFQEASDSDKRYVVLKGQFAFTPAGEREPPAEASLDAEFSGRLLTASGFTQQVSAPVTINLTCAGEWCAKLEPNRDLIAFVEESADDGLQFNVGPCYPFTFVDPSLDDVKRLENCAQGGACEPVSQARD
jgi:hypothetical protein